MMQTHPLRTLLDKINDLSTLLPCVYYEWYLVDGFQFQTQHFKKGYSPK